MLRRSAISLHWSHLQLLPLDYNLESLPSGMLFHETQDNPGHEHNIEQGTLPEGISGPGELKNRERDRIGESGGDTKLNIIKKLNKKTQNKSNLANNQKAEGLDVGLPPHGESNLSRLNLEREKK